LVLLVVKVNVAPLPKIEVVSAALLLKPITFGVLALPVIVGALTVQLVA
jgi:hypothetical protein